MGLEKLVWHKLSIHLGLVVKSDGPEKFVWHKLSIHLGLVVKSDGM